MGCRADIKCKGMKMKMKINEMNIMEWQQSVTVQNCFFRIKGDSVEVQYNINYTDKTLKKILKEMGLKIDFQKLSDKKAVLGASALVVPVKK